MNKSFTVLAATFSALYLASPMMVVSATAAPLCDKLGFAGLLAKCNRGEPIEITLASGKPLGKGDVALQSGAYYEMKITADGSAELAISGAPFFRAIWMNEIVINGIEVRPMAVDSLEFDEAGVATMSFIAIKPGSYEVRIPNTTSDSQKMTITIQ
ncbi:cupredoxin domain-containing protein [Rhizobium sp. CAU 1783]